ncbi:MAG TPA: DUF433 domain-containing protein [Ktedonobacterales bacterium]|nr:DUF433 domain-containing protein [Ktedonobacterales bacterium]
MSAVASYVQLRDGEYFVAGSQVTLRSVIASWKRGAGPERIQESFPSLPLVAIYGAITYYLEHQSELDANFQETDAILAARQADVEAQRPEFFNEMRARLAAHRAAHDEDAEQPESSER